MNNINQKLDNLYKIHETKKTLNNINLLQEFLISLTKMIPIKRFEIFKDEMSIEVSPEKLKTVLTFLKLYTNAQFQLLTYITAVDYPEKDNRFLVVYDLLSLQYSIRLRVKTSIYELNSIESMTSLFPVANWLEREVWDMFGIHFSKHPDLRRILTDYGFHGHPLRKDFPVSGFYEIRYDDYKKRIVYEKIQLNQSYRLKNN